MKKILFVFFVLLGMVQFTFAQRGLNGNSDWKVPVPVISPQMNPSLSINQIAVPNIPALPAVSYSFSPSATALNLVPPVPNTPLVPAVPKSAIANASAGELKTKFPSQKLLPPLPPIPVSPTIKMPVN
ncbi:MAG: hypothetical protein V4546_07615 [Bacteroidota bacterium]